MKMPSLPPRLLTWFRSKPLGLRLSEPFHLSFIGALLFLVYSLFAHDLARREHESEHLRQQAQQHQAAQAQANAEAFRTDTPRYAHWHERRIFNAPEPADWLTRLSLQKPFAGFPPELIPVTEKGSHKILGHTVTLAFQSQHDQRALQTLNTLAQQAPALLEPLSCHWTREAEAQAGLLTRCTFFWPLLPETLHLNEGNAAPPTPSTHFPPQTPPLSGRLFWSAEERKTRAKPPRQDPESHGWIVRSDGLRLHWKGHEQE